MRILLVSLHEKRRGFVCKTAHVVRIERCGFKKEIARRVVVGEIVMGRSDIGQQPVPHALRSVGAETVFKPRQKVQRRAWLVASQQIAIAVDLIVKFFVEGIGCAGCVRADMRGKPGENLRKLLFDTGKACCGRRGALCDKPFNFLRRIKNLVSEYRRVGMECFDSFRKAVDFLLNPFPTPYLDDQVATGNAQLVFQQTRGPLNLRIVGRRRDKEEFIDRRHELLSLFDFGSEFGLGNFASVIGVFSFTLNSNHVDLNGHCSGPRGL